MNKRPCILNIVAHADDQIFGPGGSLFVYSQQGKQIITVIFSYGEMSQPHFKKEVIKNMRIAESEEVDKYIGNSKTIFLGLSEGKFKEEFETLKIRKKLEDLILKYSPEKIFTHASDDPLPDHLAVNSLVLQVYDSLVENKKFQTDVYSFGVWRFLKLNKRSAPRLVVDISKTFNKKLTALSLFKSQKRALMTLKWSVYVKAFVAGFKNNVQFAEEFHKIR